MPNTPQQEAGIRIEPPPSLAWAMGTIPEATAAADPPLDPPVVFFWIPWVACRAPASWFGGGQQAELGCVGFAQNDEAGLFQSFGQFAVMGRDKAF